MDWWQLKNGGENDLFQAQIHKNKSDGQWENEDSYKRMLMVWWEKKLDAFSFDGKKLHEKRWFGSYREAVDHLERKKGGCGRIDRKNGLNDKEKVDGVESVSLQRGQLPWLTVWSAVSSCRHHRQASCLLSGLSSSLLFHTHCKHTHTLTHQSPILPPTQLSKRAQLNNESGHIPWKKGRGEGKRGERERERSLRILEGKPKTNLSPFNPSLHSHRGTRQQHQQKFSYPSISCHK